MKKSIAAGIALSATLIALSAASARPQGQIGRAHV